MTQSGQGQEGQSWGQAPGQPWGAPPPQAAPGEDPATQYLPPVPPAPEDPAESTRFLGTGFGAHPPQYQQQDPYQQPQYPQAYPPQQDPYQQPQYPQPQYPQQQPQYPQAYPPQGQPQYRQGPNPDAEATQYIAPVPGHGGPPAEFDNLFRDGAADATRQMSYIEPATPPPPHGHQPPPHGHR
ncbi:hypothetical protein ACE14D_27740, partial [Streptomyces sp. Act-28]